MERTFDTPHPVALRLEVGAGEVTVTAAQTGTTVVSVVGPGAEDTRIERRGAEISVLGPRIRRGTLFGRSGLAVTVTVPAGSDLSTVLGSADLVATGALGSCRTGSGSGDIDLAAAREVEATAGSGSVRVGTADGALTVRAGSGTVRVGRASGPVRTVTGSGDVRVGQADAGLRARSGSGDVTVDQARGEVTVVTASGDTWIGRVDAGSASVRSASGDIRVGVRAGLPVWTDFVTLSGRVSSRLDPVGAPQDGQDFVELRLRSASGDLEAAHVAVPATVTEHDAHHQHH